MNTSRSLVFHRLVGSGLALALLLGLFAAGCKAPKQALKDASRPDSTLTQRTSQDSLLFLNILLKKDTATKVVSASLKDVMLVVGTMKKQRVGGAGHSAAQLLVSYLNAQGNVVDSTFEDNPLEPVYEFTNDQNAYEKRHVPIAEAYLPLRVQRREAIISVRLEHWVQADARTPPLQEAPQKRTLIALLPLRK